MAQLKCLKTNIFFHKNLNYIEIAISAWVLFGIVSVLEKFLLDKPINNSTVYTFYTGLFSIFTVLLFAPLARIQSSQHLLFDLSCGLLFLIAQYCLFTAIMRDEISRVVPITGALTPVFSLLAVNVAFHLSLSVWQSVAFVLLVLGTFLISFRHGNWSGKLLWPILASLFLGVYYSLVKGAYTPFSANYAWVRLGSLIGAAVMLVHPEVRAEVVKITKSIGRKKTGAQTSGLFVTKEVVAGAAFIVLNYALGAPGSNPAIANSLQGFEFVVVLALVYILTKYFPKIIKEKIGRAELIQKILAIMMLFGGLIILELHI